MNLNKKYTTETEKIDNGKGYWDYLDVNIFLNSESGKEKIGSYRRNYSSFYNTFFAFELNGKEYALYSKDYTATRVMTLPDCNDLCGEDFYAGGFCPVDYFVPTITVQKDWPDPNDPKPIVANHNSKKWATITKHRYYWPDDKDNPNYSLERELEYKKEKEISHKLSKEWYQRHPFIDVTANFGFVAGCIWGDDSSWKIQKLDLSELDKGILKREETFGYLRLPDGMKLKDAISTDLYDEDCPTIEIATPKRFNVVTGKYIHED